MAQRTDIAPRLNAVDRIVAWVSPAAAVRRAQARQVLAYYEAAKPSPQRKFRRDTRAPDQLVQSSAAALRNQMRHLDRNHDIVVGALTTLVNNTVGPQGIGIEPQPRRKGSTEIHTEYATALREAYRDFCRRPEVTWTHDMAQTQRLMARTAYRDGEAMAQRLLGRVPLLDHGTRVPYSLELMEPDLVPLDLDEGDRIRQGIERNAWGRPVAYHVLKAHPGDVAGFSQVNATKRIPADRMLHLAHRQRIGQLRGITPFASVITRIEDLKDYEESERIAAKVAAMLTAFVKRQAPVDEGYTPTLDANGQPVNREIGMAPGMIIDTLAVGEDIGLIDSKRPNPNLVNWRDGQLRAFAAGINASYSSISRNYNGTYSSQRQEMVEQWVHYAALTDLFCSMFLEPVWDDFVLAADLSGVVPTPADVEPGTENDALFVAPAMPWIDPLKEISAWVMAVQAGFASEYEVIRRRGMNPDDLLRQVIDWRKKAAEAGVKFSSDAGGSGGSGASTAQSNGDSQSNTGSEGDGSADGSAATDQAQE